MNEYSFDHDQLSAYSELTEVAKELHHATLPQDNLQ